MIILFLWERLVTNSCPVADLVGSIIQHIVTSQLIAERLIFHVKLNS